MNGEETVDSLKSNLRTLKSGSVPIYCQTSKPKSGPTSTKALEGQFSRKVYGYVGRLSLRLLLGSRVPVISSGRERRTKERRK